MTFSSSPSFTLAHPSYRYVHPYHHHRRTDAKQLLPWTVRGIGLATGFVIVLALAWLAGTAVGVLLLLFVAILLAAALEPIIAVVRDRVPIGRGPTILVVYACFFVSVLALAFIVVPAATAQGEQILASLPAVFDTIRDRAATLRPAALSTSITAVLDSVQAIVLPAPTATPDAEQVVEVGPPQPRPRSRSQPS